MGKRGYGIIRTELTHMDRGRARMLKDMLASFRDVSAFLIHVACDNAPDILTLSSFNQLTAMERLVHRTKDNPSPAYVQFDKLFPRYPSYMRRSAIHFAVGHVQSHETRCDAYYEYRDALVSRRKHVKRMAPGFTYTPNACPTMYRKESLKVNQGTVDLKVLRRGQWVWETFTLAARDYKSLQKASLCGDVKNPKLVHEYGKFYLEFPVKYRTKQYPDLPLDRQLAIGCDLGLTNGAVLSAVDSRGSVHGRWFSPFKGGYGPHRPHDQPYPQVCRAVWEGPEPCRTVHKTRGTEGQLRKAAFALDCQPCHRRGGVLHCPGAPGAHARQGSPCSPYPPLVYGKNPRLRTRYGGTERDPGIHRKPAGHLHVRL